MKHLKILALAAMACAAPMAFASTASATTLTTTGGVVKTGTTFSFSLKAKTSMIIEDGPSFVEVKDTCSSSTINGKTTNETDATVTMNVESLSFSGCTFATETLNGGKLHVAWTSGLNGSVTSSETEVETEIFGGVCVYGTKTGTHLGTLNGVTSGNATMVISALLPLVKTISGICPSETKWTAEYSVTSPTGLTVQN